MKHRSAWSSVFFMISLIILIILGAGHKEASAQVWCLGGDFNGWDLTGYPLVDDGTLGDQVAGDNIYSRQWTIASAGRHEWRVFDQADAGNSLPDSGNSWVITTAPNETLLFTLDLNDYSAVPGMVFHPTHNILNCNDEPGSAFTAVGDFQGWNNNEPQTQLSNLGGGFFSLTYQVASSGDHFGKIVRSGCWDAFGSDGRSINAGNIAFSTSGPNQAVAFILNRNTGRVFVGDPPPAPEVPSGAAADPNPICQGGQTTLEAEVAEGEIVEWYTGSCGGAAVIDVDSSSPGVQVSPDVTTTYYARARDTVSGAVSVACTQVEVAVRDCRVPTFGEWGMAIFGLLMAAAAVIGLGRRNLRLDK